MKKINLTDCTFIIPFFSDSRERLENIHCILKELKNNYETNICVSQVGEIELDFSPWATHYVFEKRTDGLFHRTKVINDGIKHEGIDTPFICIYDTDVVFHKESIVKAISMMRSGTDCVYPYDGRFINIARSYIHTGVMIEDKSIALESVGGAVFINREKYYEAGLENENIISWGPEDVERRDRMFKLGFKMGRAEGACYHIMHPPSENSGPNKYTEKNNAEYFKVRDMSKDELREYILSQHWTKPETFNKQKI